MSEKIEFSRAEVVAMIREIREMVVSQDRIGGAAVDMPENQWKEAAIEYEIETNFLKRLAGVRSILESKFEDEPLGDDDMSDLDRELQDIEYWSFAKYREKHDL